MWLNFNLAVYTALVSLVSAMDCVILLRPVRVRHIENARTFLFTLLQIIILFCG